jgi:hypothetical protein
MNQMPGYLSDYYAVPWTAGDRVLCVFGSKKGGTMAARIDYTICRKRPKKRQGGKQ